MAFWKAGTLDHKEGRTRKNWCLQNLVLEKTPESPLDSKKIKPTNLFFFNWRLITLQYCSGFAMHWHESAMGVHVAPSWNPFPPPSPSHTSGSSQCNSPECPVSCIKPGLVIYFTFGNRYVSMLFSQTIPSLPSPTESKSLFFTPVPLFLSHI